MVKSSKIQFILQPKQFTMQITNNTNLTDSLVNFLDTGLRTLFGSPITTDRLNPSKNSQIPESKSEPASESELDLQKSRGFMRVNHCGEVCAQALYQGQALTARDPVIKIKLQTAALEENDHLDWCQTRLTQLNSHTSYLNPLWYIGSLSIGIFAGLAGDRYNLGFLAETEKQVSKHLASHLQKLPVNDHASRVIIEQMYKDEQAHAHTAIEAGAYNLHPLIKYSMKLSGKIMTTVAYYI